MTTYIRIPKNCLHCGTEFIAKTLQTKYCSHRCNCQYLKVRAREKKIFDYEEGQKETGSESKAQPFSLPLNEKEFLSIAETASLIGVSKRTVERLIASNKIQATRLNTRVLISKKNIEKLFQS